jgi:cytochrome c55X
LNTIRSKLRMLKSILLSLILSMPLHAADPVTASRQLELGNMLIQDCGSCHGLKMKGGLGPPLQPADLASMSIEAISTIILYGRPSTPMPAWNPLLSPADAKWLATQLLQGVPQ